MEKICYTCKFKSFSSDEFPCRTCDDHDIWEPAIQKIKAKLMNTTDKQFIPSRKYPDDGGADLRARLDHPRRVYPHEIVKIPTGIAVEIPKNHVGFILPRSGASNEGKVVIPGTIDCNFRGEMAITLQNTNDEGYIMARPGERLAQLVVVPVYIAEFELVDELSETDRGINGFGSTGVL